MTTNKYDLLVTGIGGQGNIKIFSSPLEGEDQGEGY
jgi:hypothetical protein